MQPFFRRTPALLLGTMAVLAFASCSRFAPAGEQDKVTRAFEAWKTAIINHQPDQALAYIPRHVDDYLVTLNAAPASPAPPTTNAAPSSTPGVDLLLRTAIDKKVPADLRPHLTLGALLQRATDRHLFSTNEVGQITLGRISVNGGRANAEVYYQGALTALRLPFLKEDNVWKIDVMALLPYAEILMRVDRTIKGESEVQQIDQLVSKLPSLQ